MVETKKKSAATKKGKRGLRNSLAKTGDVTREKAVKLALNLVEFQKTTFDTTIKVVGGIQDQAEKLIMEILTNGRWMPAEGKKVATEWAKMVRRSRKDFKSTMDKSFDLVTAFIKRVQEDEQRVPGKSPKPAPRPRKIPQKPVASVQ
ncbi:MAG: hypothetical protein AMXMBFR84_22370 [Candidatus Hydrogenedentota bacterium]